ncbi:MAG: putative zinc-binding metallopeptidase [Bacteroidales bacterium]|nr:putative zinc-binding metallopeptidase [Bacteroidales bacterium]
MKHYIISTLSLLALFSFSACDDDNAIQSESIITVDGYTQNAFDKWLEKNYVLPYNIEFKYRYEEIEADYNHYTVPAGLYSSIKMANLIKYLCIETYNEVANVEFTRSYFPKEFFMIGEFEYQNNGTMVLGTAEGGRKIIMAGLNNLDYIMESGMDDLNEYYIKTIHHEFTHIMNQVVSYPTDFQNINGDRFVNDSWNNPPYKSDYLKRGFITSYAQKEHREDFAEMLSVYVTHDSVWWEKQMVEADEKYADNSKVKDMTGRELIEMKLKIVREYLLESFNIDIDDIRRSVMRRQEDVENGLVNLTNIDL